MDLEVEKLNDLYNRELIRFISKVDFERMAETKIRIINIIQDYFKNNFKGLFSYNESELEEKVIENFQYGVDRSKQMVNDIHFFHFENLQDFDTKDRNNKEERNKVINSLNSNNPANNFADLEERIAISIDGYLSRKNYDNKNYDRYYYGIKLYIRNRILEEKNKMLTELNEQLTKQSQSLEKNLLEEYKSILVSIDQKVMQDIKPENNNNNNALMPILDHNSNNPITTTVVDNNLNTEPLTLPGDLLK